MNRSIYIVHVRWHTRQHSTIQNQDISLIMQFTILRRLLVSFCLVPILGGARLVLCLRSGPLELIIMETYVNRITLISVYVADHNCCMIIYTVFKNTQIALELKMSSSTTFTLCDLSRRCVIFQDQILTMFSIL